MNRFNLTFKGEIQPGKDPGQVKARFGKLFGIDDPQRLERFFSGDVVTLRRNLDRKAAAEYFSKLRKLGVESELVKVTTEETAAALAAPKIATPPVEPEPPVTAVEKTPHQRGMDRDILQRQPGQVDQSWAVSASRGKPATKAPKPDPNKQTREKAKLQARLDAKQQELATQQRRAAHQQEQQQREEARLKAEQDARVAAVTARREAQQEQARREAQEQVARDKAAIEETARREREETARQKSLEEETRRRTEEEAALRKAQEQAEREKALAQEARRKAAEEAERETAEQARLQAEEEARRKAQQEEAARRKAAEEARRKAAEEAEREAAEQARLQAEEEARRKAQQEEAARRRAAEEAKRRAAEEAAKRKAQERARKAEQAARRKAAREEAKRKAAEEAARRKAEREEQRRLKAEQIAREKAAKEAARRKAAEEDARRKAEEDARRKAEQEEARRKAEQERKLAEREREKLQREREKLQRERAQAEQERKKLEQERKQVERERKKAERQREQAERQREKAERERLKAEEDKAQELAAAKAALRAAEQAKLKRKKTREEALKKAAREQARRESAAKEAAERAKRTAQQRELKARAQHEAAALAAQEKQRAEHEHLEQQAQRKAMEEQAILRAAQELTRKPGLKSATGQVKTRVETPRSNTRNRTPSAIQAGAPNLYILKPFRNTADVKGRCQLAEKKAQRQLTIAALALAALLVLGGFYLNKAPVQLINGATAMAVAPESGPLLLAGDRLLLHDRAGLGTTEITLEALGISRLTGSLSFDSKGNLLALGELSAATGEREGSAVLRCQLEVPACEQLFPEGNKPGLDAFTMHPLDDSIFGISIKTGQLRQLQTDGSELNSVAIALPPLPRLALQSGLLFINSAAGPAVSVFRYDSNAFGKQLDEILLLPPPAVEAGQDNVRDFLWSADNWWVILQNPDSGAASVYRFDPQWAYVGQPEMSADIQAQRLESWGSKTLVLDSGKIALQRFNAQGMAEAPLHSTLLQALSTQQQRRQWLSGLSWRSVLFALSALTLISATLSWLQSTRALVYRSRSASGAAPIDDLANDIQWLDTMPQRGAYFRRLVSAYAALCLAALTIATAVGAPVAYLLALLLSLLGPGVGLLLLQRSHCGHLGVLREQLVLVDHNDMYHLGSDARLQYRGPFLMIDDVVLFTGTRLLPAFNPAQIQEKVQVLAEGGVRVDHKTVLIKLLQGQHPLAKALEATLFCLGLAILIGVLQLP